MRSTRCSSLGWLAVLALSGSQPVAGAPAASDGPIQGVYFISTRAMGPVLPDKAPAAALCTLA